MSNLRPPRFPCVAALLCAACIGAAGWTWMRYSYAWQVTPEELISYREGLKRQLDEPEGHKTNKGDFYLGLRGFFCSRTEQQLRDHPVIYILDSNGSVVGLEAVLSRECRLPSDRGSVRGRIVLSELRERGLNMGLWWAFDTTASRFHGASVAGLVVGAMGVFVFAVALRHWLGERRKTR